jgi:dolichol kinase
MEILRLEGIKVPVVSRLTALASRERDEGHFVKGPVTLGLGAFLAILWFPPAAAAIAIYSLAFGDGFASLVGRIFGNVRPAFMHGKSLEGSFACFLATFFATLGVSRSFTLALATACATTVVEALPLKDFDNLALPIVSGLIAIGFMAL